MTIYLRCPSSEWPFTCQGRLCYFLCMANRRTLLSPSLAAVSGEERNSTRARILTAAERLFAEQGFESVSMPEIAKASGITAGAIYKHFDGKADLFFKVVQRAVEAVPDPGGPPDITSLPRGVAAYTTPGLKLVRQLAVEMHHASARHPKVRKLLRQSLDFRIAQIQGGIADAQARGQLEPGADPAFLSSSVMVFILGLMHMETLAPQLVGDAKWQDFVRERVAVLVGMRGG